MSTIRMKVMMDETFGPVVGIMKVKDDAEAIRLMNDSPYGLTASIWTRDMDAAERIGREIETGTVYMNRCDYLDPGLAWTGVKDTGRGATLSRVGYESLTRPKSLSLEGSLTDGPARQLELSDHACASAPGASSELGEAAKAAGMTQPAVRHRSGGRENADDGEPRCKCSRPPACRRSCSPTYSPIRSKPTSRPASRLQSGRP